MLDNYRKLYDLLNTRERRLAAFVFALLVGVALVEAAGVASLLPFMAVLANPEVIYTNRLLAGLYGALEFNSQDAFLIFLGAVMFFVLIGSMITRALGFYAQVKFSSRRNHALGYRLIEAYLHQPYHWFLNRHSADLSSKILTEVAQTVYGALFPAMQVVANSLVVIFLLLLLVLVDPLLALTTSLVLGGAYATIVMLGRRRLNRVGQERVQANRARFQVVQEAFGGIKDVKIAGLEATFLARFRRPSEQMANCNVTAKIIGELPSFAMQALVFGGMLVVLLYLMMTRGGLQQALPTLAVYAFAGYRLMPALQAIYAQLSEFRYNQAALHALHSDMRSLDRTAPSDAGTSVRNAERIHLRQQLELLDIRYAYPNSSEPAVRGLSLRIPARSKIGLVGASGSGKTTTVDIILGLLQPDSGRIAVDGTEISRHNLRSWQRNLGYVPQQIYLTDESVAGNIAFGIPRESLDMVAVERAARIANLHDFVVRELPQGYDTPVGEQGVRLSGGQRQRIGIARALYHDPEVLILDEATSALDNLTERAVMEAVDNLGNQKTIVLIAHRLTTVKSCDCIYFLERGRVASYGTYDELVKDNSTFRAMAGET